MLKVLHVNDYRSAGGCEVIIDRTMRLLGACGVETSLFTIDDVPKHRRTTLRYISDRACFRALAQRIDSDEPDAIHLHNYYHVLSPSILEALRRKRRHHRLRVVMTAHDYHLICPNSGLCEVLGGELRAMEPEDVPLGVRLLRHRWDHRRAAYSWMKLLQHLYNYRWRDRRRVIDLIICPSRFMQRALQRVGISTMFLPHPAPAVDAARSRRPGGTLRWVFAGRVEPEKGLACLLDLLPAHFPGELEIIGEGGDLQRCREIVARRGMDDQVTFAGRLEPAETLARIGAAHVLILPSVCPENAPMSLLEALAVGTNILVSDLGGMREIVRASAVGSTFAPRDGESLRRAVDSIRIAFEEGSLNAFDASAFLEARRETAYCKGLMRAYVGEQAPAGEPFLEPGA